jgi:shikimate kinase / 3-dehydroquinate synthase
VTGRPLALIGFMGAGKSETGRRIAERRSLPFLDADAEIELRAGRPIAEIFAADGEARFRELEADVIAELLARGPSVLALGGGAVREPTADRLRRQARVVWLDVDAGTAWERAGGDGTRPLARDEGAFRALHAERRASYAAAADVYLDASPEPPVVAAALDHAPIAHPGAIGVVGELIGARRAVVVADAGIPNRPPGTRPTVLVPGGETVKSVATLEHLWRELAGHDLERGDVLIAVGGGATTDAAGFAAATFRRGISWIAVPTTLVGQVDAAIGGKTAIDVAAKNDVGAFHLPEAIVADPSMLETLPSREWAGGFAEAVKTGLLAGGRLHELCGAWGGGMGTEEMRLELVRRCAAFKARVVAEDPQERGLRAILNLGHTIGHGVEAAAGYGGLSHGEAVSVGLSAALWLSEGQCGLDAAVTAATEATLTAAGLPVRAPGLAASDVMDAMRADKKRSGGRPRFVLLEAVGRPVTGVDPGDAAIRGAVERAVTADV